MSKKKDTTRKLSVVDQDDAIINATFGRDDNGFIVLNAKPETKLLLEAAKVNKLQEGDGDEKAAQNEPEVATFELSEVSDIISSSADFIKAGKFGKATLSKSDIEKIDQFSQEFMKTMIDSPDFKEMTEVATRLLAVGKSYYEYDDKNRQYIPDNTYDGIRNHCQMLGIIEPTGIVPDGKRSYSKVALTWPTLSNNVDKAYKIGENDVAPEGVKESDSVEAFLKRVYKTLEMPTSKKISIELSPKLDGVSINGTIEGRRLIEPQTRGDETASVAISGLDNIEIRDSDLNEDLTFGIQYEVFVTNVNCKKASEYLQLENPYVSCRHAAAGITQRLATVQDPELLKFINFYPIATADLEGTYLERMDLIQAYGDTPEDMIPRKVITGDLETLISGITAEVKKLNDVRAKLSYTIDGMVITVADDDNQNELGRSGRTNKFQLAMKFDPSTATSNVHHIELESGDKGFRTIQVYLDPVAIIDGVRYDHVPVLSARLFNELQLCQDSKVKIHRVGDVIPSITKETDGNGVKLQLPTTCPVCGMKMEMRAQKLFCKNDFCAANKRGRILNFFKVINLKDYADSFVAALVKGDIDDLPKVMEVTVEKLEAIGLTGKLAEEFPTAVKSAVAKLRDYELLAALGIPGIGKSVAKLIISAVPFDKLGSAHYGEMTCMFSNVMGHLTASNCAINISDRAKLINKMAKYATNVTENFDKMITVGHTGCNLSEEALEKARTLGYDVTDGRKFDILIVPDYNHSSKKVDVAVSRELPILTETSFMMIQEDPNKNGPFFEWISLVPRAAV